METYCKLGDKIGVIQPLSVAGTYQLHEYTVNTLKFSRNGVLVVSGRDLRWEDEEIRKNTEWMLEARELILVLEPCVLTSELRQRAERWVNKTHTEEQ